MSGNTARPSIRLRLNSLRKTERPPAVKDQPVFLLRASELLQEGYTMHECFTLLLPHHCADSLQVIRKVEEVFREGENISEILEMLGFPNRILLSVKLSESDGRLAEALRGASIRMEAAQLRRQKFVQAATYPAVLITAMAMLLVAFKLYFLPNFETLADARSASSTGLERFLPRLVAAAPDAALAGICALAVCLLAAGLLYRRLSPEDRIRKISRLPVAGKLFTERLTRLFASETGNLLAAGNTIQEAMMILGTQKLDPLLAHIADTVRSHAAKGEQFHIAVQLTGGLTKELSFFAKHGADSGHLSKELLLFSEQLGNTLDRKVNRAVAMLQPALFVLLAVCMIAAYLALLLPVYGMIKTM
ncbi:competence type IV pilus assembly protein ComGB [Sporosarcina koreensis]|uniref:competence type IV pilus assembly protein ComGB n=1 Tax=Sporosarcina koreensis TaxID=334735 RepID=UPI00058FA183|nr:competence type IV pilus assembly protein ComGB [Sporosarcina koreensis]